MNNLIRAIREELAARTTKAKALDPARFYDDRLVRRRQASDFMDVLCR